MLERCDDSPKGKVLQKPHKSGGGPYNLPKIGKKDTPHLLWCFYFKLMKTSPYGSSSLRSYVVSQKLGLAVFTYSN